MVNLLVQKNISQYSDARTTAVGSRSSLARLLFRRSPDLERFERSAAHAEQWVEKHALGRAAPA